MLILMDLKADFNQLTTNGLLGLGCIPNPSHDAVTRYNLLHTHTERMVLPVPYKIAISTQLVANPQFKALAGVINEITARLKAGTTVAPYLSNLAKLGGQRDNLLTYWGIHHLHLSSICTLDAKGKVKRADYLLFVRFYQGVAHLIQIESHKKDDSFEDVKLLEIADSNWPYLHDVFREVTVDNHDAATIKTLRKKNINHYLKVNGRVLSPTFGVMANGVSAEALWHFDSQYIQLDRLESEIRRNYLHYFSNRSWIAHVALLGFDAEGYDLCEKFSGQNNKALRV
ncbi:hypothetical protein RugamoR64_56610 [Duganella rhizosphaerae]|uniref:hypothetical protein n=1 Tax=Duganella rhizosphaerae TaxID=2885763 RepID=UPI0030E7D8F8